MPTDPQIPLIVIILKESPLLGLCPIILSNYSDRIDLCSGNENRNFLEMSMAKVLKKNNVLAELLYFTNYIWGSQQIIHVILEKKHLELTKLL